jgi:hypothetical protein
MQAGGLAVYFWGAWKGGGRCRGLEILWIWRTTRHPKGLKKSELFRISNAVRE